MGHILRLATLVMWIGMTACAFSRGTIGDDLKPETVETIKRGSTSRIEVVKTLGAPDRIIQVQGREILQYYHYDMKSSSLLLILVNFSRFTLKSDDLYIFLRHDGVVEDLIYGRRTDNLDFRFWPFSD